MIYTVTLNPSIDYIVKMNTFRLGAVNRASSEIALPGGKGINVSVMLSRLGVENTALGFLAGFTGEEIRRAVRARHCREDFIFLESGFSRINVKLKTGEETEINGNGPKISSADMNQLMRKLQNLAKDDVLVLSGSVPSSLAPTIYREIMACLTEQGVRIVVDAARSLLTDVLPCGPFLVKPNHHELGEIFGVRIDSRAEAAVYARKMQRMGAANVLVSMAEKGAVLAAEDGCVYECDAPQGRVVNSVGAGDSMVAGFLAGYLNGGDFEKALMLGIAAGSASAFSEDLAEKEDVIRLLKEIGTM
ncbi:MAG: 1-phosphofructokinase [Clostridia bacterium]|nr:1-phosphofructokinase [Clostridia bacterium]